MEAKPNFIQDVESGMEDPKLQPGHHIPLGPWSWSAGIDTSESCCLEGIFPDWFSLQCSRCF